MYFYLKEIPSLCVDYIAILYWMQLSFYFIVRNDHTCLEMGKGHLFCAKQSKGMSPFGERTRKSGSMKYGSFHAQNVPCSIELLYMLSKVAYTLTLM